MIALIDADSLIYKTGFTFEEKVVWNELEISCGYEEEPQVSHDADLLLSKRAIDNIIENILFNTGCDEAELWLTGKGNFRYDVKEDYKGNRVDSRKPIVFDELWDYLIKEYGANVAEGYEADDVVVFKKEESPDDYVLCAIDKDVLLQTEGYHYNYGKDEYIKITKSFSEYFFYFQTLTGDVVDGYSGCKGIGNVAAVKALGFPKENKKEFTEFLKKAKVAKIEPLLELEQKENLWEAVVETYESKGFTEEDALIQARMASMKQLERDDKSEFKVVLWEH